MISPRPLKTSPPTANPNPNEASTPVVEWSAVAWVGLWVIGTLLLVGGITQ